MWRLEQTTKPPFSRGVSPWQGQIRTTCIAAASRCGGSNETSSRKYRVRPVPPPTRLPRQPKSKHSSAVGRPKSTSVRTRRLRRPLVRLTADQRVFRIGTRKRAALLPRIEGSDLSCFECPRSRRMRIIARRSGMVVHSRPRHGRSIAVSWSMPKPGGKTPRSSRKIGPELLVIEGHEIAISNPDKVLFPEAKYTKLDVVRYYLAVAEGALRGAGGRPNMLVRYPNGIAGEH